MEEKTLSARRAEAVEKNRYTVSRDDLYNLTVRKKAAALCVSALQKLSRLAACYEAYGITPPAYAVQNGQACSVCRNIFSMLTHREYNPKTDAPPVCLETPDGLLLSLADDLLSLAHILEIRRAERELAMCAQLCVKQLIEMNGGTRV